MQNSLDNISSSFVTLASSVSAGGNRAEQTNASDIDGQFSGLLNQAFQGKQPEAQTSETSSTHKNPAAQAHVDKSEPEAEAAEHETTEAHHPDRSHQTHDKPVEKTDKKDDQSNAQDVQALILPPQAQALNLAMLHATHLLGQTNLATTQTGEATTEPSAKADTAVNGIASSLPQVPSQGLLSVLPPLAKGLQNTLAFALPGKGTTAKAPAITSNETLSGTPATSLPTLSTLGPDGLPIPQDGKLALPENTQTSATTADATVSPPTLKDLTGKNGLEPVEGLGMTAESKATAGKPNATAPASDAFKNALSSLHETLNDLHGSIESVPEPSTKGIDKEVSMTSNDTSAKPADINAADLLAVTGISLDNPNTGAGTATGNDNAIPQFSSIQSNPMDQVADGTAYSVKNGQKELIIRLNPNNLGEVRVNLISHGNQELSARLIASTQESHDLLKGQLDSLKSTLEAQGVTVDRLSVVLAGSADGSNTNHSGHHPSSQHHEPQQSQQQTAQQGSFQQQFNQQNPGSNALFGQMNSQSQPQFASQRLNTAASGTETDMNGNLDGGLNSGPPAASNDNGRISILA